MSTTKKFYDVIKNWLDQKEVVKQALSNQGEFPLQEINLEPIFFTENNFFMGVLNQNLLAVTQENYASQFHTGLMNINYWLTQGRSIPSLLPIRSTHLLSSSLVTKLVNQITQSALPIGLIRMPLLQITAVDQLVLSPILEQFYRLGVILEIIDFTGEEDELHWLNDNLIQGVHLSTGLLRAAAMSHEKKQIMDQIMNLSSSRHFHTYSGGISLVHDFNFAKNNSITFTYGSFLMPAVTKHQILKIKHSQFSSITSSTNFSRGPHPRNPTCSLD